MTGPEKYRLFSNVDWPCIFPQLPNVEIVQQLWCQFFQLISTIRTNSIGAEEIDKFETESKAWLTCFLSIYQTKNVTPYIHLMVAHLPEFLRIHGPISPFTQQGLENSMMCTRSTILGEATTERLKHSNKCFYKRTGWSIYQTLVMNERNVPIYVLYALNPDTTKELVLRLHQAPKMEPILLTCLNPNRVIYSRPILAFIKN